MATDIFKGFYKLAETPFIGHRRADLTAKNVLFYRRLSAFLGIYQPAVKPLKILSVLHGKRNCSAHLEAAFIVRAQVPSNPTYSYSSRLGSSLSAI